MQREDRAIAWAGVIALGVVGLMLIMSALGPTLAPSCPQGEERNDCLLTAYTASLAVYTLVLAIATVALVAVGLLQGAGIFRQLRLSREEFNATHRPRLRVRLLRIEPPEVGKKVVVRYEVTNVGEGDAVAVTNELTIHLTRLGTAHEYKTKTFLLANVVVPGQTIEATNVTDADASLPSGAIDWVDQRVMLRGIISYRDRNGIPRKTGFIRANDTLPDPPNLNRFYRIPNNDVQADYEYED